jgi:hypothetical protein
VEVVLQRAGEGADDVEAPVLAQLNVDDLHLEHVTRFGALDGNGPREDVRPAGEAFGALVDFGELRRHMEAGLGNELRRAAQRIDGDAVAALDRQQRLAGRVEEAPVAVLRARLQVVMLHLLLQTVNWRAQNGLRIKRRLGT